MSLEPVEIIPGANMTLYPNNSVVFTPPPQFVGTVVYTYQAQDYLNSISNKANITIVVIDLPPVAVSDNATTLENNPVDISVMDNDYSVVCQ